MQALQTISLTESQIDTVIKNWSKILNAKVIDMFKGKPKFSAENEKKYNLQHITKFANMYILKELKSENSSIFIIIVVSNNFDKQFMLACAWFYHLIDETKINGESAIYICPSFVVTESMKQHMPRDIFPVSYRLCSLTTLYPLIGSKNNLFGLVYKYELIPKKALVKPSNNKQYPCINYDDPIVLILNGDIGDVIEYKRILFDGCPFIEVCRRVIV